MEKQNYVFFNTLSCGLADHHLHEISPGFGGILDGNVDFLPLGSPTGREKDVFEGTEADSAGAQESNFPRVWKFFDEDSIGVERDGIGNGLRESLIGNDRIEDENEGLGLHIVLKYNL